MIVDSNSIPEGHSIIQQQSDLETVKNDLPPLTEKVAGNLIIDRRGATLYIQVQFNGRFDLECARCLSVYHQPISGDFRLILEEREGHSGPAGENETANFYFDASHPQIDISPFIYEEIMTSLPIKPLCDLNCKGIVVNTTNTKHNESWGDPRWDALRKLKDNE
jgi:uncharacterized protein